MENLFDEIGIPKNHIRKSSKNDRFVVLVNKQWLKSLCKHSTLTEFIPHPNLESWPLNEEFSSWLRIFVSIYKKRDAKVIPLPRIRQLLKEDNPLMYHQLLQYICQTNYKNLWKDAYKKYVVSEFNRETQVPLVYYNDVLREILLRIYGCPIVNSLDTQDSQDNSKSFDTHPNILLAICGIETLNAFFLFHFPYFDHTLSDCVTFSPAILDKCWTKPLFIIYQLLQLLKSFHDRSLTLGDISLNDIYLTENLWIHIFPQVSSNIYMSDNLKSDKLMTIKDCKLGHKFVNNLRCENCGLSTFDKVSIVNKNLQELSNLWIEGKISNFTYISVLNKFSGRKLGDPNCHYVFPWVTDFASSNGKNWRDLKKSKYRLNKGDRQLDLTYDHSQTQVPHHVSDVLSPITFYVYMARRTPKTVLCKNVRSIWVPAEYPSSIQRMHDWTPDECIPEFFTDPSVFRSIHDDLDDLEVPLWASGPEDFVEKHRQALESDHVSERLHYWIDLTFGYKLSGTAAVKAKNVCLHLADDHTNLTKSGLVQLFVQPHPPKAISSPFFGKLPPKIVVNKSRSRDRGSEDGGESGKSDEDEITKAISESSLFGLSRIMSRSRSSLSEDQGGSKISRSPSAQRSTSLGPKNATFTSHLNQQVKGNHVQTIELPKEYKPEFALENLEKRYSFMSKTFFTECAKSFEVFEDEIKSDDHSLVQNAFTNFIYTEGFKEKLFSTPNALKSHTFPVENSRTQIHLRHNVQQNMNQIMCNYSEIISKRKVRELQVLGCLIVEIFMAKHLRALGSNNIGLTFSERFKNCLTVIKNFKNDIPRCISYIANLLLQPSTSDLKMSCYAPITHLGLPPPSAHLLLEPLLDCLIPFQKSFSKLYMLLESLKEFKNVELELDLLYHFDCDGTMCSDYEQLEKTKILFSQNIAECKVKLCVKHLEELLIQINPNYDVEIVNIIVSYIVDLIEDPPTSVLSAWYLFDPIARVLGPRRTSEMLLQPILKLFENEPNESSLPFYGKIAKLYHHSFLLRLIVRLGLKCFLENFMTPLVEAVGGYKDYEKIEFSLHTHLERIAKKTSHLKTMQADKEFSSETAPKSKIEPPQFDKEEDLFELDEEKENEEQMRSLIEHLELNIASDLPFNHSTAEEALDAFSENIDQLQNIEEMTDEGETGNKSGITSPTIPIPSSYHNTLANISCEIGSRISESGSLLETKSLPLDSPSSLNDPTKDSINSEETPSKPSARPRDVDIKISEISVDSIIWLSHRLGPVLMARFLSRNLLKMLTLCYVGRDNLTFLLQDDNKADGISISFHKVVGDQSAIKVLDCLASIAALYGEKLILFQYLPHISELLTLSKKKLTATLEGGLISGLVLLKHIIPYLSDSTLMDQLQDIFTNIIHPTVRLLGSIKHVFPNGSIGRNVLARKYIDTLYILSIRIGSDMSRKYLSVPSLQRFFLLFDKTGEEQITNHPPWQLERPNSGKSHAESETCDLASTSIPHIRLKDSESLDSLSPTYSSYAFDDENIVKAAIDEIQNVFTPDLAHTSYLSFLNHIGIHSLDISLKNHDRIRELCQIHEQEMRNSESFVKLKISDFKSCQSMGSSGSIGSNISVIGNRIDVQDRPCLSPATDLLSLVSNRIENSSRHLRGNWFSYWAHEIGRHEKDNSFNFNQIKLQTFVGHINSVKCIHPLDNENSFMSGSRDKTVKLWSLRSQGDGSATSNCQWTYTNHKKSILSMTFIESMRLVASCDSVVHLWDPFMGVSIAQLESSKYSPVNVVRSMPAPSSLVFSATTEGAVKIIDTRLTTYVYDLKITVNPSGLIRCMAVSPSGNWIAAGQSSGCITVLDTRTGLVISSWRAHEGEVLQLGAVDDNAIISSSLDQTITVWSVNDGKFKHHMRGPTEPAHCLVVYDQCQLVSATTANRVGVHTSIAADSSYSSTKLRGDTFKGLLTAMAILPLNRLLLLGADNGQISLLC
ncbi:WD repeat-containing protein 81 [Cylas formicarius]|uniref:WD repeat-containing protein 81 n=1 Tax=Cylas formicarius TaxID=197179 RepID=UPI002958D60F|nr:WD repeat-containing protein 81 [Cylas formicarius]